MAVLYTIRFVKYVLSKYGCCHKIKCDNSLSEIEFKGHQSFLTVFHTVKTYKAKLQFFREFSSKFQFFLLNKDIFVRKLKSIYRTWADFDVL